MRCLATRPPRRIGIARATDGVDGAGGLGRKVAQLRGLEGVRLSRAGVRRLGSRRFGRSATCAATGTVGAARRCAKAPRRSARGWPKTRRPVPAYSHGEGRPERSSEPFWSVGAYKRDSGREVADVSVRRKARPILTRIGCRVGSVQRATAREYQSAWRAGGHERHGGGIATQVLKLVCPLAGGRQCCGQAVPGAAEKGRGAASEPGVTDRCGANRDGARLGQRPRSSRRALGGWTPAAGGCSLEVTRPAAGCYSGGCPEGARPACGGRPEGARPACGGRPEGARPVEV